ncbi:MAG: radical SAM protein [Bacilli bacterium]|nr:radical SAM protein [Bacilli bacterium]
MKKCYIIPTESCSCNCTFCISKSRDYKNKLKASKDNPFLENAKDILNTLKLRGIKNFEITGGGEPFLDKNLSHKISLIKTIIQDAYIKIYTNGNHLHKINGLDEINISIAHYNDEINKQIMNPKIYVSLIDKLTFFRNNYPDLKIRLSIPLLKEGINNEDEIKKLIEITEKFDVEYVIRTIYPHTPNYEENYVNVNYNHPQIKYERDNDVSDFNEIIWWSNNELYANWSLKRKKHLFSYLLLKPDSQNYVGEILNLLDEKDFSYYMRLYEDINKIMYLYRDKEIEYQEIIKTHLKALSILFGSEFIVLFLNKKNTPLTIEELVLETSKLKYEIRNMYAFTQKYNGTINYGSNTIEANLVHAPDFAGKKLDEDIDFLNRLNYDKPKAKTLSLAKKYRSYKV